MQRFFFLSFLILLFACKNDTKQTTAQKSDQTYSKLAGETMGTTYNITYGGEPAQSFKTSIDSLLVRINQEVSTYEKEAVITQFNKAEKKVQLDTVQHTHFLKNLEAAVSYHDASDGYFDPTVMPLVNYWGFGYTGKEAIKNVDSLKINSLLKLVGMRKVVQMDGTYHLYKTAPGVQLDFSAHAKGYGVDQICEWLEQKGIQDYFVEIGGELRVKGKNPYDKLWTVGINRPEEQAKVTDFMFRIALDNKAIATSGNYRNVYEVDGIKYFHTISPFTGYPQRNRLLSASVLADDCMTADAYATAFMAMGLDKAFQLAKDTQGIEAAFIYSDESGEMQIQRTEGFDLME